jgi:hypothetical protein
MFTERAIPSRYLSDDEVQLELGNSNVPLEMYQLSGNEEMIEDSVVDIWGNTRAFRTTKTAETTIVPESDINRYYLLSTNNYFDLTSLSVVFAPFRTAGSDHQGNNLAVVNYVTLNPNTLILDDIRLGRIFLDNSDNQIESPIIFVSTKREPVKLFEEVTINTVEENEYTQTTLDSNRIVIQRAGELAYEVSASFKGEKLTARQKIVHPESWDTGLTKIVTAPVLLSNRRQIMQALKPADWTVPINHNLRHIWRDMPALVGAEIGFAGPIRKFVD